MLARLDFPSSPSPISSLKTQQFSPNNLNFIFIRVLPSQNYLIVGETTQIAGICNFAKRQNVIFRSSSPSRKYATLPINL